MAFFTLIHVPLVRKVLKSVCSALRNRGNRGLLLVLLIINLVSALFD